jgi:hypothetical protein
LARGSWQTGVLNTLHSSHKSIGIKQIYYKCFVCDFIYVTELGVYKLHIYEIRKWKANWIGHILLRNCLLRHATEGNIKGGIEVKEGEEEDVGSYWMKLRKEGRKEGNTHI